MSRMTNKPIIARVSNRFAMKGRIGFTKVKQLRVLIGAISEINPFDDTSRMEAFISVQHLKSIVKEAGEGEAKDSIENVKELVEEMMNKNYVEYDVGFEVEGVNLSGFRVLFDKIKPQNYNGIDGYCFRFHDDMRPDFQNLAKNYLSFGLTKHLKSGASFRFSMVLMSYHNRHREHKEVTELKMELQEFRRILNLEKKYPRFNNLKSKVVDKIIKDVNKLGVLYVWCKSIRTGRKVTHLTFYMKDGENYVTRSPKKTLELPDYVPTKTDIEKLSRAKLEAYKILVDFGVKEGIALQRIVFKIQGSEARGFEDIFITHALTFFKAKARKKHSGTFVKWWTEKKVFDASSDVWTVIMEKVVAHKKKLEKENSTAFNNRMIAMEMTNIDFEKWYEKQ